MMSERFLEDFVVGQVFKHNRRVRVGKDEIIAFARQYDPQYFHLDEEAARNSIFGRLVASGWHTAALTMRLITESEFKAAAGTVGLGCAGWLRSFPAMSCMSRAKCSTCGRPRRAPIAG
jgi:acyl dehydratase